MDTLTHAVIHSLDRPEGETEFSITCRNELLDCAKPAVDSLARQLVALVGRDGSSVTWGQFRDDRREGPFPNSVQSLLNGIDDDAFMAMSLVAMQELMKAAQSRNFATGGYVCFVAYEVQARAFLLLAIIKERGAVMLSQNFEPTEIQEIDLSKLHQAARINLARYAEHLHAAPESDDADEFFVEKTYLSFVNRRSRDNVASYFIDALGCQNGLSAARATKAVVQAVFQYIKSVPETRALAAKAKAAVVDYMAEQSDGANITLDRIVDVVRQRIGAESVELCDHLVGMKEALNGEQYQIPDEFTLSSKTLTPYSRIKAKTDNWQLQFENGSLGTHDSEIVYDRASRTLKFTRLPDELVSKVEEALAARKRMSE